jgi:hypothetical protein
MYDLCEIHFARVTETVMICVMHLETKRKCKLWILKVTTLNFITYALFYVLIYLLNNVIVLFGFATRDKNWCVLGSVLGISNHVVFVPFLEAKQQYEVARRFLYLCQE